MLHQTLTGAVIFPAVRIPAQAASSRVARAAPQGNLTDLVSTIHIEATVLAQEF